MLPPPASLHAITLDLDDTLWPIGPTILRAEAALAAWLLQHAPRVAERFDSAATIALRAAVARDWPDRAHDLTALRRETIRRMLAASGEDEALAAAAFDAFFAARQQVECYADVRQALERLAARWPLLAVTNGNADLDRTGLSPWFVGRVCAQEVGVGKPDPRIFAAACDRLGVEPIRVLHVGDDLLLDVQGALGAGMHAAWLRRGGCAPLVDAPPCWHGPDLLKLAENLGA
jgi:putative hydrolase of the HAD superfamily